MLTLLRRFIYALAFLSAVPLWSACDRGGQVAAIEVEAAPAVMLVTHGEVSGGVVARTVDRSRLVVSVDAEGESGVDGSVDHVFTFQTGEPMSQDVSFEMESATLRLVQGNLFIDPEDGSGGVHLAVDRFNLASEDVQLPSEQEATRAEIDLDDPRRTYVGAGLAHQLVSEDLSMDQARDASSYTPVETKACVTSQPFALASLSEARTGGNDPCPRDDEGNLDCYAGGEGSTSCSITRCSTSCGEGLNSCCNTYTGCGCCPASTIGD